MTMKGRKPRLLQRPRIDSGLLSSGLRGVTMSVGECFAGQVPTTSSVRLGSTDWSVLGHHGVDAEPPPVPTANAEVASDSGRPTKGKKPTRGQCWRLQH